MTVQQFLIFLGLGSAAIAFWLDVRFPSFAPDELGRLTVHLVGATLGAQLVVPLALTKTAALGGGMWNVGGVFLVGLPALVYLFVTGIWLVKLGHAFLGRYSR